MKEYDSNEDIVYVGEHCKISGDKNSDKFCHFRFRKKLFDDENKHG